MPKDEDFAKYWFQQMILRCDIDGARKVIYIKLYELIEGCDSVEQVTQPTEIFLLASHYLESQCCTSIEYFADVES